MTSPNLIRNSPSLQGNVERALYCLTINSFDESRHLKEREEQYVDTILDTGGILIVRETAEGWWKESLKIKKNIKEKLQELIADPTVACGWIMDSRFPEKGGWGDLNG